MFLISHKSKPKEWLRGGVRSQLDNSEIDSLIAARVVARKAKNFAESDRIRDALNAQGIILEDGPKGTTWRQA